MRRTGAALLMIVMAAGLVLTPAGRAAPVQAANSNTATTVDALNLRAGPSLADRVVTIMPPGSQVMLTGASRNGFYPVTYGALSGWTHGDYLRRSQSQPAPAGAAIATDVLNLRAGPSLSDRVLTAMPAGATITLTGQISNGFRSVSYKSWTGWASAPYLRITNTAPSAGGTALTTDSLNLRAGPSTAYAAVTVIPFRARVTVHGQRSNGFADVSWNGLRGWAYGQYLAYNSPPAPAAKDAPFTIHDPIVGPSRGSVAQVMAYAQRRGSQRLPDLRAYVTEIYRLAPQIGFDPAILVAQSELETNGWTDRWWTQRLNPAGLGVSGDPRQVVASFSSGTMAARAQIAHMHAEVFGGAQPLPDVLQGVDQAYQAPFRAGWAGTIRTVHDLVNTWAVDNSYDAKIVRRATYIFG